MEHGAIVSVQLLGKWEVRWKEQNVWGGKKFEETAAKIRLTWMGETGGENLKDIFLYDDSFLRDFNMDLNSL